MWGHRSLINIEIFQNTLLVETFDTPEPRLRRDLIGRFPDTPVYLHESKDKFALMPAIRAIAHKIYKIDEYYGDWVEGCAAEIASDGPYIRVMVKTNDLNEDKAREDLALYFKDIPVEFDYSTANYNRHLRGPEIPKLGS